MRSAKVFFRSAKCGAVSTPTTTRCTLGFGHRHLVFTFFIFFSLWTHLFFFLMNPRTMMTPPELAAHVFTVWQPAGDWELLQGAAAWRHRPELTVVTWCKLWSTHLTLSGDLLNYDDEKPYNNTLHIRYNWKLYNECMTQEHFLCKLMCLEISHK